VYQKEKKYKIVVYIIKEKQKIILQKNRKILQSNSDHYQHVVGPYGKGLE
jgi:hypothetical protein